jgi:hypothetical protein
MFQNLSWAYLVATNEKLTQIVGIYLFSLAYYYLQLEHQHCPIP